MAGDVWTAFGAAFGGALLGGVASSVGGYLVARSSQRRRARVEVYEDLLPAALYAARVQLASTLESDRLNSAELFSLYRKVQVVSRKASVASKRDYRLLREARRAAEDIQRIVEQDAPTLFHELGAGYDLPPGDFAKPLNDLQKSLEAYEQSLSQKL